VEEEVNSGSRIVDRVDDSLSAALGNKEHTGRVRGVSVYRGWKDVYDGPKPHRRPRAKVNKDEMESRLAQVRQEVRQEITMEYTQKMVELESRLLNQMSQMKQSTQPSENGPPISPGIRRSSQGSGTEVLGDLDNLKVITTCS
jgi:hypothetical protein